MSQLANLFLLAVLLYCYQGSGDVTKQFEDFNDVNVDTSNQDTRTTYSGVSLFILTHQVLINSIYRLLMNRPQLNSSNIAKLKRSPFLNYHHILYAEAPDCGGPEVILEYCGCRCSILRLLSFNHRRCSASVVLIWLCCLSVSCSCGLERAHFLVWISLRDCLYMAVLAAGAGLGSRSKDQQQDVSLCN